MKFFPLLIIKIKHTFYNSGNCPDFSVSADPQTARILTNHRCIVKSDAYGLTVYAPHENQQPLIRFSRDCQLSFNFKLKRDDFALYTEQCDDVSYSTNLRLELTNSTGVQLYQKGLDCIIPKQDFSTTTNEMLLRMTVQRDFNDIRESTVTHEIRFFAKPVLYVFYVVTNPGNSTQLLIIDTDQSETKTTWQVHTPTSEDKVNAQLTLQYPGMEIVCFNCDQTLTCHESSAQHLQLKHGEQLIFDYLPSPSYQHHFQTDPKPTDAIYQIVTYLTDTTLIKG